jgi:DNA-binding MarR family transcriptional regulator
MRAVRIDPYVLEVLMRDLVGHDRSPAAFLVYLALWHRTRGAGLRSTRASLRQLAEATGLSKSAVQGGLRRLKRRKLVRSARASPTAVPEHFVLRPWAARGSPAR